MTGPREPSTPRTLSERGDCWKAQPDSSATTQTGHLKYEWCVALASNNLVRALADGTELQESAARSGDSLTRESSRYLLKHVAGRHPLHSPFAMLAGDFYPHGLSVDLHAASVSPETRSSGTKEVSTKGTMDQVTVTYWSAERPIATSAVKVDRVASRGGRRSDALRPAQTLGKGQRASAREISTLRSAVRAPAGPTARRRSALADGPARAHQSRAARVPRRQRSGDSPEDGVLAQFGTFTVSRFAPLHS